MPGARGATPNHHPVPVYFATDIERWPEENQTWVESESDLRERSIVNAAPGLPKLTGIDSVSCYKLSAARSTSL